VLVGTQMVTKGHDFRRVTLVAAVDPDGALFTADFRAPERLFATLMQAAGRAGRAAEVAVGSEMWIQTANPSHPLFAALRAHDYARFADSQLHEREMAGLPPFAHLALLRAEARGCGRRGLPARGARRGPRAADRSAWATPSTLRAGAACGPRGRPRAPPDAGRIGCAALRACWRSDRRLADPGAAQGHVRWAVDVDPVTI
jgi:primosomal protein N' (replication factor Y)